MAGLKLSSPWQIMYRKFEALFGEDKDVKLIFTESEGGKEIKLLVDGDDKAAALAAILPEKYEFGNVPVAVTVVPANSETRSYSTLFSQAFAGNPAFSFVKESDNPFSPAFTYVVFRNKVVQIWADDLGDVYGNDSMLYEDAAAEIFAELDGVRYCTDLPDNLAKGAKDDGGQGEAEEK